MFMSGRIGETETKNLEFSHRGHRGHGDKEKSLFVVKDKNSVFSVNSVARKNLLSVSLCLCGYIPKGRRKKHNPLNPCLPDRQACLPVGRPLY